MTNEMFFKYSSCGILNFPSKQTFNFLNNKKNSSFASAIRILRKIIYKEEDLFGCVLIIKLIRGFMKVINSFEFHFLFNNSIHNVMDRQKSEQSQYR